ncbi:MAG: hypothetical protein AAGE01_01475 [Pseudomonadota bacterium]
MKIFQFMLLAGVLAVAGCASNSQQIADEDVAVSEGTVAKAERGSSDDLVCKRYKPIGSNMTKKVCQTRAEAEAQARRTQDGMNRNTGRAGGCISCGGDG